MDGDPEVTPFVAGPWEDAIQHKRFVREHISRNYGDGLGCRKIIAKDDPGRFLGSVMLVPHNEVGPDVEIGWRLNRAVCEGDLEPRRRPDDRFRFPNTEHQADRSGYPSRKPAIYTRRREDWPSPPFHRT